MILDQKIFRAYDIRGQYASDFDAAGFAGISEAVVGHISDRSNQKPPHILVTCDARLSSPALLDGVVTGLLSAGAQVTYGGVVPTPVNYLAFAEGDYSASLQITASHNPPTDNGLKLTGPHGAICGDEIQTIAGRVDRSQAWDIRTDWTTEVSRIDTISLYSTKISALHPDQIPLSIVVDAGNAIPGAVYPDVLRALGHTVHELYCDTDGSFPNHQPDPEDPTNLRDCTSLVQEKNADLGLVFDGDGDRVGVILSDGTALNADQISLLLAADYLGRHPGASVVCDLMMSAQYMSRVKALGGQVRLSQTGHSFIEQAMHAHAIQLGSEQSGHFMFGEDFYGHDDGLLAAIRVIESIQHDPQRIDMVTTQWTDLAERGEKFVVPDEKKFLIMKKLQDYIAAQYPDALLTDGVRLDWDHDQWGIIRCSNTSPKISLRIQAQDEIALKKYREIFVSPFREICAEYGVEIPT